MRVVGMAVVMAGLTLAGAATASERLQVPQLAGWKVVATVTDRAGEATDLIPDSETQETWTRRITIQAFRGVPLTAQAVLEQVVQKTAEVCDGATAGPASLGSVSGLEAGTRSVACGRYKGDGRGTFTLHYVIRGREALYVVNRQWRGQPFTPSVTPISAEELQDWTAYVNAIEVCDTRDPARPCK